MNNDIIFENEELNQLKEILDETDKCKADLDRARLMCTYEGIQRSSQAYFNCINFLIEWVDERQKQFKIWFYQTMPNLICIIYEHYEWTEGIDSLFMRLMCYLRCENKK